MSQADLAPDPPAASASTSTSGNNYSPTLDTVLNQITTATSAVALAHALRANLPKDSRDAILSAVLPGGQDPLEALDVSRNTLGVLWILSARLTVHDAARPPTEIILDFCRFFDPEQARLAPDRVTMLAKGILRYAAQMNDLMWAIEPLYSLVTKYPPDGSYLTTIHPIFVLACAATRQFPAALPVLQVPITNIDTNLSDLTYLDNLRYHYIGAIALAALKRWSEAEDFLEICIGSPGMVPSAIQLEAVKKLKLIQLIYRGKTSGLPRYAHPALSRLLKNTPYIAFINAYPQNTEQLQRVIDENRHVFMTEKNMGLIMQAFRRTPRWTLKKLTATYLTLGLADIGRAIKINSESQVRELLLSMIEANDISASISEHGTVTFFDSTRQITKEEVDGLLRDVQQQAEYLRCLEREMGKSREYLRKAVRHKDDPMWAAGLDDDLFAPGPGGAGGGGGGGGGGAGWVDDPMYV
ncbi:hypothetical protein AX17_003204 [Amanita inopinata Kibby_2008]|nr:hypothetical protein AX17_003204 [Amanita inopinata Kibby_2008]